MNIESGAVFTSQRLQNGHWTYFNRESLNGIAGVTNAIFLA